MRVPIIIFKTEEGFSASIVGLKYLYLCHETYEELKNDFIKGIGSAIEGLQEDDESIPTSEEMKKELIDNIGIQNLEDFYKIEFIDYKEKIIDRI